MAKDLELEAAIEANPNDVDAYHIYADWLQTEDDPRGTLIVLQAALDRDPGNKKLAAQVAKLMRDEATAFLPPELADLPNRRFAATWKTGFVRDAAFDLEPDTDGPAALRALLRHPSGRFVQSLRFSVTRAFTMETIVDVLLAERRPTTLTTLTIDHEPDEERLAELRAAFPRLGRSLAIEWRTIIATLAEHRRLTIKYDPAALPALARLPATAREVIAVTPEQIARALRLELDKSVPLNLGEVLRRTFTAESLDRFAIAFAEQFIALGEPPAQRWGFEVLRAVGGDASIAWMAARLNTWSYTRDEQAIAVLMRLGRGAAHFEVYRLARFVPRAVRRELAAEALAGEASLRETTVDRLVDASIPAGLDDRGLDTVTRRLVEHMLDGRRFDEREFMRYVVTHPGVGPLAERVVWATYEGAEVELAFRTTGSRAVDIDGNDVDLEGARIGVLHPAELASDERAAVIEAWRAAFDALEIAPLVRQLDRPVFERSPRDTGSELPRWKLRKVGFDRLRSVLADDREWEPRRVDSEWGTDAWQKTFPRGGVTALAHLESGAIGKVVLSRSERPIDIEHVDAVTASELLFDLETATSAEKRDDAAAVAASAGDVQKGARVRYGGRVGVVFWLGQRNGELRCGVRPDDSDGEDDVIWTDIRGVDVIEPAPPVPVPNAAKAKVATTAAQPAAATGASGTALAKGAHVKWKTTRHAGTGTLFWLGKNKFGDGMRAGVKDDETGETVWCDAADCDPS